MHGGTEGDEDRGRKVARQSGSGELSARTRARSYGRMRFALRFHLDLRRGRKKIRRGLYL